MEDRWSLKPVQSHDLPEGADPLAGINSSEHTQAFLREVNKRYSSCKRRGRTGAQAIQEAQLCLRERAVACLGGGGGGRHEGGRRDGWFQESF